VHKLRYLAARVLDAHNGADARAQQRAFVSGEWRIIDRFDAGGRRYVIARREVAPDVIDPDERTLLLRRARGETLKEIARDHGLSVSAVSRRLSNAMKKLGIGSHAELARLFSGFDDLV
jgi:DNA-binding NarL/FixJ family response regulator